MTLLAVVAAVALYVLGDQGLYWDAAQYYQHGMQFAKRGLFEWFDGVRTYGYPMFIALIPPFSGDHSDHVRVVAFLLQLAIYLAICYFAARRIGEVFRSTRVGLLVYALTALNPILLIHTTVLLSDLLSTALVYLAFALALPTDDGRHAAHTVRDAALSALAASFSVMVRPGNVVLLVALLVVWLLRAVWRQDLPWRALPLVALAAALPFVPQVYVNYRERGEFNLLMVDKLGDKQLGYGLMYLKGQTIVIGDAGTIPPGQSWQTANVPRGARVSADGRSWDNREGPELLYKNPFIPPGVQSPLDLLLKSPPAFVATLALHGFGLVDHDFPFPYVREYTPWYRWPLALLNYPFLILALAGTIGGIVNCWAPGFSFAGAPRAPEAEGAAAGAGRPVRLSLTFELRPRQAETEHDPAVCFTLLAAALLTAGYLAVYLLGPATSRYSLPLYLLGMPGFVYAVQWLAARVHTGGWRTLQGPGIVMAIALVGCVFLSNWIWEQGAGPRVREWQSRETQQAGQPATPPG